MQEQASHGLLLRARMLVDPSFLRLEYEVSNEGDRPAFLFDILHHDWSEAGFYPLGPAAYVEMEPDRVVVSRKLFPVPDNLDVEARNIPFCTRVLPGAQHTDRLSLPLPLIAGDPYRHAPPATGRVEVREVFFQLGFFRGAPGTETLAASFPTDHGQQPGFDVFDEGNQLLLTTGPLGHAQCDLGDG